MFVPDSFTANQIVYARPNGGRVLIPEEILASLSPYVQDTYKKKEAGGVILGRYIKDCEDIVVDKVTLPMRGDKSSRFSFLRQRQSHQKIIDQEWQASNFTCTYLGEWHTHPEPLPTPSFIDRNDWKRKMKQDIFDSDYLFFMIVGTSEIRLWEGNKHTCSITALSRTGYSR